MINLNNLVELHDKEGAVHRHKRILEELFYLCINHTFVESIQSARVTLQGMANPIDLSFPCTKEGAVNIRNSHFMNMEDYQVLLNAISERHSYYHPSFTRNYRKIEADAATKNQFNVLENIIFFNDPIPERDPLNHFKNRSGFMEIGNDEIDGPCIKMQFDLGTSKTEIINIIDKLFPETSELQAERYNVPQSKYRADGNLRVKEIIHKLTQEGDQDSAIAVKIEALGLVPPQDNYDYIRQHKQRMAKATERFEANA